MPTSANDILQLQADATHRLLADEYFADVVIIQDAAREIGAALEQALAGISTRGNKRGAAVIVLVPQVVAVTPNVQGPQLDADLGFIVVEKVLYNRDGANGTGKVADVLAVQVLRLFHHWACAPLTLTFSPVAEPINPLSPPDDPRFENVQLLSVRLRGRLPQDPPARAAAPTITQGASTITLAAGSGATIVYTTDGTSPSSTATGTTYSAPFAKPSAGTVIRACAYETGKQPSNITAHTVT